MITLHEALDWLNLVDVPHLDAIQRETMKQARSVASMEDTTHLIDLALQSSRASGDSLAFPEALLNSTVLLFYHDDLNEAHHLAEEALAFYNDGSLQSRHRRASTLWMLGQIELELHQRNQAHLRWAETRDLFRQLSEESQASHESARRSWYLDRLRQIECDIVCLPEETFGWLNRFEPSSLESDARQVRDLILKRIKARVYGSSNMLMRDMRMICRDGSDYRETPEVMVEAALLAYESNDLQMSMDLLQNATAYFYPNTHQQVVARWMLGAVQWNLPTHVQAAMHHWRLCLLGFSNLTLHAEQTNQLDRAQWYAATRQTLEMAFNDHVSRMA